MRAITELKLLDKNTNANIIVRSYYIPKLTSCHLLLKNAENNHDAFVELVFDHNDILVRASIFLIGEFPAILFTKLKQRTVRSPIVKTTRVDQLLDFIASLLANAEADKDFECVEDKYVIQIDGNGNRGTIYVFGNKRATYVKEVEDAIISWSVSKELEVNSMVKMYSELRKAFYSGIIAWSYPYQR